MTSQSYSSIAKALRFFGLPSYAATGPMLRIDCSQATHWSISAGGTRMMVSAGCSISATQVAMAVLP